MMGHYYYYIDSPDDHDCMWSGDCCLFSQSLLKPAVPDEIAAATLAAIGGKTTSSTGGGVVCGTGIGTGHHHHHHHHHQQQQQITVTVTSSPIEASLAVMDGQQQQLEAEATATTETALTTEATALATTTPLPSAKTKITTTTATATNPTVATNTRNGGHKKSRQQQNSGGGGGASSSGGSGTNEASRGQLVANKKLRHREVEKNRHRQLQAMVKNISERIPGRLDKETQVQTMKRAARYCLYLRDTMNLLTHGQAQLQLQKVYLKAWDSVELMSQC